MEYSSLHEYLDIVFKGKENVCPREIKLEKRKYWRNYNTALKRRQRKKFREFSVRFSKGEYAQIKPYIQGKPISVCIHEIVMGYVNTSHAPSPQTDTVVLEQQLFLISHQLDEFLINGSLPDTILSELQEMVGMLKRLLDINDS